MSAKSKIEWTDATWNPTTGCHKVGEECRHCYAEREWQRLSANPKTVYFNRKFIDVAMHAERLDEPLRWTAPRRVFVDSMSDLFHDAITDPFLDQVFAVMAMAYRHTFQVLTKRPQRAADYFSASAPEFQQRLAAAARKISGKHFAPWHEPAWAWPLPNVHIGVSAGNQAAADERVPLLKTIPARARFVSCEPLLEHITLPAHFASHIDWVIAGGESGYADKCRPLHPDWVRALRDQCADAGVGFHFKQWGSFEYRRVDPDAFARDAWRGPDETVEVIYPDGRRESVTATALGKVFRLKDGSGMWERITKSDLEGAYQFRHVGKADAGRELDGRVHDDGPRLVLA